MRGTEQVQDGMFSYVSLEQRVPQGHPLRTIRELTDEVLRSLNGDFDQLYSVTGRPSIAPDYLLRALLLQVFYSVRSERLLVEQIDYNLLFRWFVGLGITLRHMTIHRRIKLRFAGQIRGVVPHSHQQTLMSAVHKVGVHSTGHFTTAWDFPLPF